MSICPNCNSNISEGGGFCPACGTRVAPQQYQTPNPTQNQAPANAPRRLHCPQCKSIQISPITESSVNGALTTHHGGISSSHVSNTHRNYWMCSICGTKFRNIQNLEEEIAKSKNSPIIFTVLTIIGAIISLYLIIQSMNNPFAGLFLGVYAWGAAVATIVFFCFIFVCKNKLNKMKDELAYLKVNCFN